MVIPKPSLLPSPRISRVFSPLQAYKATAKSLIPVSLAQTLLTSLPFQ